ncbi:MAG: transcription antitermination factor NusB [Lachnospiraceae bacterium]|nr:transcription antitermination factor NusB [Lachnospiraceae bacterium]
MTRHELRDRIFKMLFRVEFHDAADLPDQFELFREDEENLDWEESDREYIHAKYEAILGRIPELDRLINDNTTGWDTTRIGKVELAVLRLAAYEMKFDEDIPEGVAIDEAVELAKRYGQENSGSFVNAILSKIQKA